MAANKDVGAQAGELQERTRTRVHLGSLRDYAVVFTLVALFIVLATQSNAFLSTANLLNILDQWSALGIVACGLTLVLIAGGFDMSIGSVYALGGVVAAQAAISWGVAPGLLLGVVVGLAVGIANGFLVTKLRINPFVATLASGMMVGGAALGISGGLLIVVSLHGFNALGGGKLLGLKVSIWLLVATIVIASILLHRTRFGRYVYAVGGNAEAARLSGISVSLVRTATYALGGLAAGLGGVIAASRVATGQSDAGGFNLVFQAYAAVIIGGTSIAGGAGALWRTVVGVLFLAIIGNGFNLLGVSSVYQQIILGTIMLIAVAVDAWSRRH